MKVSLVSTSAGISAEQFAKLPAAKKKAYIKKYPNSSHAKKLKSKTGTSSKKIQDQIEALAEAYRVKMRKWVDEQDSLDEEIEDLESEKRDDDADTDEIDNEIKKLEIEIKSIEKKIVAEKAKTLKSINALKKKLK